MLKQLIDNTRTDKQTRHQYLDAYEETFSYYKDKAKRVLEIGIDRGGSIHLWRKYFPNATIYGMDCIPLEQVADDLKHDDKIVIWAGLDAYATPTINELKALGIQFDIIIDDGSHLLNDMKKVCEEYTSLLTPDGCLVIEDVKHHSWAAAMADVLPQDVALWTRTVDLREPTECYDSFLFIVEKNIPFKE